MEKRTELALGLTGFVIFLTVASALLGVYAFAAKLFGVLLVIVSIFLIAYFPGATELQPEATSKTGILIGIILFFIGIWLIFF